MKIIRHSVFETNSSSTHSLTFSKEKEFVIPGKAIVIKMRDMNYLCKEAPEYYGIPECDQLKTMTTRDVINRILSERKNTNSEITWALDAITRFLDAVNIDTGYEFDKCCWYNDKYEKETKHALEYIKTAEYPQFDSSVFAPETNFVKKLEFLYCMALSTQYPGQVPYKDLFAFLKAVVKRAADISIKIEVPYIENCDNNVMEYPDDSKYEGEWKNPEFQKECKKYDKWRDAWMKDLRTAIIPVSEYSVEHYERTLVEMRVCGYDHPMYMELHDDYNIVPLRKMFKGSQKKLVDWLFDSNSGFYRYRNG